MSVREPRLNFACLELEFAADPNTCRHSESAATLSTLADDELSGVRHGDTGMCAQMRRMNGDILRRSSNILQAMRERARSLRGVVLHIDELVADRESWKEPGFDSLRAAFRAVPQNDGRLLRRFQTFRRHGQKRCIDVFFIGTENSSHASVSQSFENIGTGWKDLAGHHDRTRERDRYFLFKQLGVRTRSEKGDSGCTDGDDRKFAIDIHAAPFINLQLWTSRMSWYAPEQWPLSP